MIGIIGVGNMGSAILHALTKKGFQLIVFDKKPLELQGKITQAKTLDEMLNCRAILICVKPKDVENIGKQLRVGLSKQKHHPLIISIAAVKTLKGLEKYIGQESIIRLMPNLAAKVNLSATCFSPNSRVNRNDLKLAKEIISSFGTCIKVKESDLNAVTALSGCGPAYFYQFSLALVKAGISMGLKSEVSLALVKQTLFGTAKLIEQENKPLEEFISEVATPGGATEAALKFFKKKGLNHLVKQSVQKAKQRCDQK